MTVKPESPIIAFASPEEWQAWLDEHQDDQNGVWLKLAKAGSNIASVTRSDALDVALCYGWIDGQSRSLDERFWLQRFTPRRPRSKWSQINTRKVEELIAAGRMQPAGLREIERAKRTGGGTPPMRLRARRPYRTIYKQRWIRIRRRQRSSKPSTARTATRSSTAFTTPNGQKPVPDGSPNSSTCSASIRRFTHSGNAADMEIAPHVPTANAQCATDD